MNRSKKDGLKTWIEVDRSAIAHNFNIFKSLISPKRQPLQSKRVKLMAVVKGNAYGHSIIDFSKEMERLSADFLGVDSILEGLTLRRKGIKLPILVLNHTMPGFFYDAAINNISLSVSTIETLRAIERQFASFKSTQPLRIHINVDTGMHRDGFLISNLPKIIRILTTKSFALNVKVEGLYTHFANAKNPSLPDDTNNQLAEFQQWIVAFKKSKLNPIVHAAATAGTIIFPSSHFDMVRVGIGLYGLWPSPEVKTAFKDIITLKPVLTWKSIITEIKKLPAGSRVGYHLTETLVRNTVLAIVPIGYWHGYPRALSSIGRVIVKKKETEVIGRVSMNMLTIDVSKVIKPKIGDEVIIMGGPDSLPVSIMEHSRLLNTYWYEIITRLNPLIKRVYI